MDERMQIGSVRPTEIKFNKESFNAFLAFLLLIPFHDSALPTSYLPLCFSFFLHFFFLVTSLDNLHQPVSKREGDRGGCGV